VHTGLPAVARVVERELPMPREVQNQQDRP
jgi:hypothetical protein